MFGARPKQQNWPWKNKAQCSICGRCTWCGRDYCYSDPCHKEDGERAVWHRCSWLGRLACRLGLHRLRRYMRLDFNVFGARGSSCDLYSRCDACGVRRERWL